MSEGNQIVSILYFSQANSSIVNKRHKGVRQIGIYSGGYLSKVDNSHVNLSPLICEITDGTHQVRVETIETIEGKVVSSANPYVILRWNYTGSSNDYMEILTTNSPAANDLIVGKCSFDGDGNLQGFSYSERSTPNTQDLFLKVEPTEETELRVRIREGRIQTNSVVKDIPDQKSDTFTPPASNKKIYLVYVTADGVIGIDSSGTPAATPVPPSYKGKLVLAEVTLTAGDTNITADKIKDVRPFVTSQITPDGVTVQINADGKLAVITTPTGAVGTSQLASMIDLSSKNATIFGSRTNLDSLGSVLAINNVYRTNSDGVVSVTCIGLNPSAGLDGYSDGDNPPVTWIDSCHGTNTWHLGFSMFVKKNDYWKIVPFGLTPTNINIRWLPVGVGNCTKQ